MGNKLLCGEAGMRCVANCARISVNNEIHDGDYDDGFAGCDPAGTTFHETLEKLPYLDKQLLLFSAGHNVEVVRWLFLLGASEVACDQNRTTALHTACRSGTIVIVKELVSRGIPVDVVDSSGWTPLHIATFMGRRHIVGFLLQSGASITRPNGTGQTSSDLCNDAYTREVLANFVSNKRDPALTAASNWSGDDFVVRESPTGLRYEPFFVPRQPVLRAMESKKELLQIGIDIFNRRPGQGLAFLVTTGCIRDYPVDMSSFLRRSKVDLRQVGHFLAETYSLSQILRLEFINSVRLSGNGVVGSLAEACEHLKLPEDLQKIDRLLHGIARIWWRQHEQDRRDVGANGGYRNGEDHGQICSDEYGETPDELDGSYNEIRGAELKQYLSSPDSLHQLMCGVLLLHWSLHDSNERKPALEEWLKMNKGLEGDKRDIPARLLEGIYHTVKAQRIPQLAIPHPKNMVSGPLIIHPPSPSLISQVCVIEGPVTLLLNSNYTSLQSTASLAQLASVMSEVVDVFEDGGGSLEGKMHSARKHPGYLHMYLTAELALFSTRANEDPFAFLPIKNISVKRVNPLVASISPLYTENVEDSDSEGMSPSLHFVFLLPDGRWQTYDLNALDFQTEEAEIMEQWISHLTNNVSIT
eukprot:GEMP01017555.1.p1 GENE.GEMP01017555.1~~GEMP01017555.1.p1  ORF type:complete len:641 (+),score=93.24 GEMP01017555.1:54-1976(+)